MRNYAYRTFIFEVVIYGYAGGVMVIVVENGIGRTCSNFGQGCGVHFTHMDL